MRIELQGEKAGITLFPLLFCGKGMNEAWEQAESTQQKIQKSEQRHPSHGIPQERLWTRTPEPRGGGGSSEDCRASMKGAHPSPSPLPAVKWQPAGTWQKLQRLNQRYPCIWYSRHSWVKGSIVIKNRWIKRTLAFSGVRPLALPHLSPYILAVSLLPTVGRPEVHCWGTDEPKRNSTKSGIPAPSLPGGPLKCQAPFIYSGFPVSFLELYF